MALNIIVTFIRITIDRMTLNMRTHIMTFNIMTKRCQNIQHDDT
jgi:hypothetical protein